MKRKMIMMVVLVACLSSASFAFPTLQIDFRTAAWIPADSASSYNVGNTTATPLPSGTVLWQDTTDGLGVYTPPNVDDEITQSQQELLQITFDSAINLNGVALTDLFVSNTTGPEHAQVTLFKDGGQVGQYTFAGTDLNHTYNGELMAYFAPQSVDRIDFIAVGLTKDDNSNDYSVAGLTTTVPAPGAILLAGLGTGLVGFMRRRKSLAM